MIDFAREKLPRSAELMYQPKEFIPFAQLAEYARVKEEDISFLVRETRILGKRDPLKVDPWFFKHASQEAARIGNVDELLFADDAIDLVRRVTKTPIPDRILHQMLEGNSVEVVRKPKGDLSYWECMEGEVYQRRGATYHHTVPLSGSSFGPRIVHRSAVLELAQIADIIKKDVKYAQLFFDFSEKRERPMAFLVGDYVIYVEKSRGTPTDPQDSTYDGSRIQFIENGRPSKYLGRGVQFWGRIGRFEVDNEHYNVVIMKQLYNNSFRSAFGLGGGQVVSKLDGNRELLKQIVNPFDRQASRIDFFSSKPQWYNNLVNMYRNYQKN